MIDAKPNPKERSTRDERRGFGFWVFVFVLALFVIPIVLKAVGLLPARR